MLPPVVSAPDKRGRRIRVRAEMRAEPDVKKLADVLLSIARRQAGSPPGPDPSVLDWDDGLDDLDGLGPLPGFPSLDPGPVEGSENGGVPNSEGLADAGQ